MRTGWFCLQAVNEEMVTERETVYSCADCLFSDASQIHCFTRRNLLLRREEIRSTRRHHAFSLAHLQAFKRMQEIQNGYSRDARPGTLTCARIMAYNSLGN
eukprot:768279-Hanusia_phi.AAC.4